MPKPMGQNPFVTRAITHQPSAKARPFSHLTVRGILHGGVVQVLWGHLPPSEGFHASEGLSPTAGKLDCLCELLIVVCQGGLDRKPTEKMKLEVKQVGDFLGVGKV